MLSEHVQILYYTDLDLVVLVCIEKKLVPAQSPVLRHPRG